MNAKNTENKIRRRTKAASETNFEKLFRSRVPKQDSRDRCKNLRTLRNYFDPVASSRPTPPRLKNVDKHCRQVLEAENALQIASEAVVLTPLLTGELLCFWVGCWKVDTQSEQVFRVCIVRILFHIFNEHFSVQIRKF